MSDGAGPPHHVAHQLSEDPLEPERSDGKKEDEEVHQLLSKDAVDDEVDRTVDSDQEVVCLGEGVVHLTKVLETESIMKGHWLTMNHL